MQNFLYIYFYKKLLESHFKWEANIPAIDGSVHIQQRGKEAVGLVVKALLSTGGPVPTPALRMLIKERTGHHTSHVKGHQEMTSVCLQTGVCKCVSMTSGLFVEYIKSNHKSTRNNQPYRKIGKRLQLVLNKRRNVNK